MAGGGGGQHSPVSSPPVPCKSGNPSAAMSPPPGSNLIVVPLSPFDPSADDRALAVLISFAYSTYPPAHRQLYAVTRVPHRPTRPSHIRITSYIYQLVVATTATATTTTVAAAPRPHQSRRPATDAGLLIPYRPARAL